MTRSNIVLISIDSLRADECGYLSGSELTPNLDQIASEGIAFQNAVAPGCKTYESMPSIWAGRLISPVVHDAGDDLEQLWGPKEAVMRTETLPEKLQRDGYTCGAFTVNPHTPRTSHFRRGFDDYEDFLTDDIGAVPRMMTKHPLSHKILQMYRTVTNQRAARPLRSYYDRILEWIERAPEPFFLWVFLLDPHTPYLPAKEYRSVSNLSMTLENIRLMLKDTPVINPNPSRLRQLYRDTIRETDAQIGQLRDELPDKTITIIHSDHGEAFGPMDHGEYGHQSNLYEENIHVPMVIDTPSVSRTISEPVSLINLPSIIRTVADGEYDIQPKQVALSRVLSSNKISARTSDQKYIVHVSERGTLEEMEGYDLDADPNEQSPHFPEDEDDIRLIKRILNRLENEQEIKRIYQATEEVTD